MIRRLAVLPVAALLAAGLTACSAPTDPAHDGVVKVVASTNVYASIAQALAGSGADVTAIIDDPTADPHSFEANPRVQLELAQADLVIANGGGYDDFVDTMYAASGNSSAVVLHAVDFGLADPTAAGFNEHVWYDYPTMSRLAATIASDLDAIDPDPARAGLLADFQTSLTALEDRVSAIARDHSGEGVVITEPVPLYLLTGAGLMNLTPPQFSAAIEDDSDVPPTLLQEVLTVIPNASVVVVNGQTSGPQTDAILAAAATDGVPSFAVTETIPAGLDYLTWQSGVLDQLEGALG
ncbi:MAG: zinc ABC transporter substrate-binding protein [Pseudolysinimonas sp.]|uniref:metal ABC transporter solute-binding protein, Zn/Mn family n=1 Tax=Pseudolysinimonas sp. TaxID=2680009 RepID=UPI0032631CCC